MSEEKKNLIDPVSITEEERNIIRQFVERSKIFPELIVKEIEVEEEYKKVIRFKDEMTHPIMKNVLVDNTIQMRVHNEEVMMGLKMFPWAFFKFLVQDSKTYGLGLWEATRTYGVQTRKSNDHRFPHLNVDPREEKETYYFMVQIQEDGTKPHVRVYLEDEDDKNELRNEWMERVEEKESYELVIREYIIEFYRYYEEFFDMHSKFIFKDGIKLSSVEKYLNFTKDFLEEVGFYLEFMYFCYKKMNSFQYFCLQQNMEYCKKEIESGLILIEGKRKILEEIAEKSWKEVSKEDLNKLEYVADEFYDSVLMKPIHNPYQKVNDFNKAFLCPRKMNIKNEKEIENLLTDYCKVKNESGYMFIFIEGEEVTLCPSLGEILRTESFSGDSQTSDEWQKSQIRNIKKYVKDKPKSILKNEKENKMTQNIRSNWEVLQQSKAVAPQLENVQE
ncbi:hypothetical protein PDK93_25460 [Bacillus cereus]|nr:hypothetical protein [Bacillus cereus]